MDSAFQNQKEKRFNSVEEIHARWLSIHAWPEDYRHCLDDGSVWAEPVVS